MGAVRTENAVMNDLASWFGKVGVDKKSGEPRDKLEETAWESTRDRSVCTGVKSAEPEFHPTIAYARTSGDPKTAARTAVRLAGDHGVSATTAATPAANSTHTRRRPLATIPAMRRGRTTATRKSRLPPCRWMRRARTEQNATAKSIESAWVVA
jgi:hypothetical protein